MGVVIPICRAVWMMVPIPSSCASRTVTVFLERVSASRTVMGPS